MSKEYTVFGLAARSCGPNVSSFVHITMSDMAILGLHYNVVPLTFPIIRGRLAQETGNDQVTVPTLITEDGFVTDSWAIAQWLEKHHGTPSRTLFPNGIDRSTDEWMQTRLAPAMRPLFRPGFWAMQDGASRNYFLSTKYMGDNVALEKDISNILDPVTASKISASVRKVLSEFENKLGEKEGVFVNGDKPSHADSAVFGWYLSGQVSPGPNYDAWVNSGNPRVRKWVAAMEEVTRIVPGYQ
ncbi:uncharacterized protein CcaverHIS019_0510900 [Cutaneotrichosporon cavernicola]|uniref:GST N-terminal domain-containing protein n=1 Tax=Cutaneotrichosporon cavernicola TaxID=279322 RepID=A0AA48L7M9_9TREE|nr:uncharacterized protein CcaverHIS019_0510900 [Cutaneotrichosporon cavernicola]BEI93462.1 hypothetical protein CcaverHIS019_0510900 [Cutaneotrichosporon cavernicola]BEJ01241.1 hypothetical protein CcaverHIS631_0510980 [Cutaneotrichosporon cavernicola]BEJ09009.1 hypothetical protein CcaverHIS641_0511030 [Cutaneotrichosporon cavernicola]